MIIPPVQIDYPDWVQHTVDWDRRYTSDHDKMRLAIDLSRQNVVRKTGGPFGAAIFNAATGELVSVGMNSVVRLNNCTLHGEMVAFMMAQSRLSCFSLRTSDGPEYVLATSCEPCAMCLGATLWSGVRRVLCGASRDDARRIDFDEGPVFPDSYAYLAERGIRFEHGLLRDEADEVLQLYGSSKGIIYNG
ncbi:nucleoside deaminase [Longimicrobium terrae]|uniref:tRNA(Arg) A34 adenosine deaminase TadA n=1 Tax=Longimicrobium terrae TaxID=1639882 RepID=A0A841H319_9BACT|nr:nucleoside deaminase [Longimicrobium terrae]MBB4637992.1 tRNA(Arg) A34 adenosine deaminase TadA [Longimicrobium terrae]MBB6072239.1 tRNA(Arg) A34 adenosine deaminase TadA [Longimicrobium terrae]NNC28340.1 nucleoside deaminase [Longimicrobium terrae]